MQTLRKKTSPCKYRNDPGRFFGDGVTFKAKLIGILEVGEARGDKMCQEALQDLKMAIRAAGEHKQRITIHVTIDGLRLRDEKTSDSLYHHPVHKISFIAQDMTDSRAFGYIFGSPDSGHRFFGIKTDKAASQVVLAMRDLFQVVFELKKKEIELARQQIQSKNTNNSILEHQQPSSSSSVLPSLLIKSTSSDTSNNAIKNDGAKAYNTKEPNLLSPESVADLVDLEQELSSIQRGITQLDRITPNEPTAAPLASLDSTLEDPFGDSFTNFSSGNGMGSKAYNLLPPPESSRSRHSKPIKASSETITTSTTTTTSISSSTVTTSSPPINRSYGYSYNNNNNNNSNANSIITTNTQETENWLNELHKNDVFNESTISGKSIESITNSTSAQIPTTTITSIATTSTGNDEIIAIQQALQLKSDAFTELDPLGTGTIKPYVDKKYFFHELKNPPKKVLKDLSGGMSSLDSSGTGGGSFTFTSGQNNNDNNNEMDEIFDDSYELSANNGVNRSTGLGGNTESNITSCNQTTQPSPPVMLPRDTDPFSPTRKKSDPFQDGDIFSKLDPFEFEFTKGKILPDTKITTITNNDNEKLRKESTSPSVFNGPLQVQLPPDSSWSTGTATTLSSSPPVINNNIGNSLVHTTIYSDSQFSSPRGRIERQSSESPTSNTRNRPSVFKQNTVDVISSISSKKMPHLFGQKFTKRDSHSINMRRLQESDSLSENETAPEPPPRPDTTGLHNIEPPPLPPKKQFSDIVIRPRITSSSAIQPPPTRYDYVTAKMKSSQLSSVEGSSLSSAPPIPLPSRRIGRTDSSYPGPGRPRKPGSDDSGDYLAPLGGRSDVPPLLPPPQTKGRSSRRQESLDNKITTTTIGRGTPPTTTKLEPETILPDITLSQLLTLGIDDLANKLNVPTAKLNTMTIVELTTYLSEFLERSKKPKPITNIINTKPITTIQPEEAVFKVNFDQNSDTFIAKFDDNFGEESTNLPFIANFSQFDIKPEPSQPIIDNNSKTIKSIVPSADRYAVFREIIDQENMKSDSLETDEDDDNDNSSPIQQKLNEFSDDDDDDQKIITDSSFSQITKIDTKITEAISHAKDRYAALRDIILVEDLFEKPTTIDTNFGDVDFDENIIDDEKFTSEICESNLDDGGKLDDQQRNDDSSPDSNENFVEIMESSNEIVEIGNKIDIGVGESKENVGTLFMHTLTVSSNNKDDLEIDELMNRAISNLSLDSRDHLSPNNQTKSPTVKDNVQQQQQQPTSPISPSLLQQQQQTFRKSPLNNPLTIGKSQFNDVSTSPIPIQQSKSPIPLKSPLVTKSPTNKSPAVANLIGNIGGSGGNSTTKLNNSGSLSDMICGSSPDLEKQQRETPPVASESWAIFDKPNEKKDSLSMSAQLQQQQRLKSPKGPPSSSSNNKDIIGESPCSSDGKDDWKNVGGVGGVGGGGGGSNRRWPKGQTSSSSRDLSPWDDEATAGDYKKRIPPGVVPDRHGYYVRHAKRMNSCDDDYEYEEEIAKRRERKPKSSVSRSRENFEFDTPNWYQPGMHHSWSPQDEDVRARAFERGVYERNSYGPPIYGDHKPPHSGYDRRAVDYKPGYDKRKYYRDREYCRPAPAPPAAADYDFESYGESPDIKDRKMMYSRRDYENIYEDTGGFVRGESGPRGGSGIYKSREYFYGSGERRSFDRESIESYDSTGRRRKSFGSGEVYGSFDSREEFRERYLGNSGSGGVGEKTRSLRMGFKMRGSSAGDDYEQDSENDVQMRRAPADHTRSLQRPGSGARIRKSSGSSPWDGEEPPPPGTGHGAPKGWKRPSSASESTERRLAAENRRVLGHTLSGGSDGEKDRRFRKKQRSRGKEGGDQRSIIPNLPPPNSGRYSSNRNDNYDYPYDDYDQSPVSQTPSQIDEDKFERLNRRRHDMNQRMIDAERRKRTVSADKYSYDDGDDDDSSAKQKYPIINSSITGGGSKKEIFYAAEKDRYARGKFEIFDEPQSGGRQQQKTPSTGKSLRSDFDFDDFEETPQSNTSSNGGGIGGGIGGKFNFEEQGFESDFNTSSSPPTSQQPPSATTTTQISSSKTPTTKSSFRFSNDFSTEKQQHHHQHHHNLMGKHSISSSGNYDNDFSTTPAAVSSVTPTTTTPSQKLRFDDKVTISKFDNNEPSSCAFDDDDDDFSKAQFNFENEDQWNPNDHQPKKNIKRLGSSSNSNCGIGGGGIVNAGTNKQYRQQENIRKSESVNIFAKKSDDPFEDDDFFKSTTNNDIMKRNSNNGNNINKLQQQQSDSFQWDNNFAKFDENM